MQHESGLVAVMAEAPGEDAHLVEVEGQAGAERSRDGEVLGNLMIWGGGRGVSDFGQHPGADEALASPY